MICFICHQHARTYRRTVDGQPNAVELCASCLNSYNDEHSRELVEADRRRREQGRTAP